MRQLEALYPHLSQARAGARRDGHDRGAGRTPGPRDRHQSLASRVGEIVLEKLLDTLMRTAIEHAGAERGLLLLPRGDELRIAAEATTSGDTVSVRLAEQSMAAAALPESIVSMSSARETACCSTIPRPARVCRRCVHPRAARRSILCVPLLNQAKLTGVLYLENTLTPHVFTPSRLTVLKLLASQAAIALENARLAAERQAHLWFLESLDRINRAMQGTQDLEQMLGDVLDAVLAIFACDRVTLGTYSGAPEVTSFSVAARRERAGCAGPVLPGVEYPIGEDLRALPRALQAAGGPVQFHPGSTPPLRRRRSSALPSSPCCRCPCTRSSTRPTTSTTSR